ncbi:MAG TPA: RNA-binding S4 domain-containing protein [Candidatus Sphingobacterium stercoripullorum]|uniref:RNA-binding S4 domain-containing protein n=1 Tax=Candidatus Sphingobacterium stercoripullorum TaxID=2838759 RepID=A0A9D2AZ43_9SPHI|nr:RNA-binding S4 domain-containing protein [Candidatus Sphingobacterium stercoripullorum]HLR50099.1 RNA-binding S4 domain-containing protein [Candidatus Sphingobacterium stercoripullorum]
MEQFILDETREYIHLVQLLKAMGWAENGSQAQQFVVEGLVKHNNQVDYRKRLKVRAGDVVEFDGMEVQVVDENS